MPLRTPQHRLSTITAPSCTASTTAAATTTPPPPPLPPVPPDDSGVELLLGHWGGEVAYFWLRDQRLIDRVGQLGRARVIEVAVPVAATRHSYSAGDAVVATFARKLGCKPDRKSFDLYVKQALGPEAILAVRTEGEAEFMTLASTYPPGSADPTIGDYDDLVAEMEATRRRRGESETS